MNTQRCLKIAERMNTLLMRELGQGIEAQRMVTQPLYARDVLLVCDALHGTDLTSLAQHFRVASTERPPSEAPNSRPANVHSTIPGVGSGFGARISSRIASRFSTGFGSSGHDTPSSLDAHDHAGATPPPRRWFLPARWLAGK